MSTSRRLQKLARERQRSTGERYTTALAHVRAQLTEGVVDGLKLGNADLAYAKAEKAGVLRHEFVMIGTEILQPGELRVLSNGIPNFGWLKSLAIDSSHLREIEVVSVMVDGVALQCESPRDLSTLSGWEVALKEADVQWAELRAAGHVVGEPAEPRRLREEVDIAVGSKTHFTFDRQVAVELRNGGTEPLFASCAFKQDVVNPYLCQFLLEQIAKSGPVDRDRFLHALIAFCNGHQPKRVADSTV